VQAEIMGAGIENHCW